jgi:hypothetical protein
VESPESWFEDVGFGTLVNGRVEIRLDPNFAATVQTDQYHVFIMSPRGQLLVLRCEPGPERSRLVSAIA